MFRPVNLCRILQPATLVYDRSISLGDKVSLIWDPQSRFGIATLVYAMTRYGTIAEYAFPVLHFDSIPQLLQRDPNPANHLHAHPKCRLRRYDVLLSSDNHVQAACISCALTTSLCSILMLTLYNLNVLATLNIVRIVLSACQVMVLLSNDQYALRHHASSPHLISAWGGVTYGHVLLHRLASIMISHFILNLREVNKSSAAVSTVSCVHSQHHAQPAQANGALSGRAASFSGLIFDGGSHNSDLGSEDATDLTGPASYSESDNVDAHAFGEGAPVV
ncbi:hypothetical protein C8Q80DRAFT_516852 [Daedaleopsis nitida]|nr:hypothetical protein C8Q80DRAFT_516852 [Daedaleopsis nitida]